MQLNTLSVSELTGLRSVTAVQARSASRTPIIPTLLTGLEIEAEHVEGDAWLANDFGWDTGGDGSLRDGGIEWRLARPSYGNDLSYAIEGLYGLVESGDLSFEATPRAGTHIHVNLTDQKFGVVQAMTALMYCIDQLVFEWADDNRMWCSYCNSMNTLPPTALRALLASSVRYPQQSYVWPLGNGDRYYGFNITSLFKYGSLEFRYFPTTTRQSKLWEWVDFTHLVFKGAQAFVEEAGENNISEYILSIAREQPSAFLEKLFSECPVVLNGLSVTDYATKIASAAEELTTILSVDLSSNSWVEQETVGYDEPRPEPPARRPRPGITYNAIDDTFFAAIDGAWDQLTATQRTTNTEL